MTSTIPGILARIVERKHSELSEYQTPVATLSAQASTHTRRDFAAALRAKSPAIIAEIKKASPSRGLLATYFNPAATALSYQQGGAAAISVLTDRHFFQGGLSDLAAARASCTLPVIRKDFTVAEYHVHEAAAHGADAILLIAAILDVYQLRAFRELAKSFQMAALVEVHHELELERALASGAEIIGVNNRDLNTFEVHLETSLRLAPLIPSGVLRISESGIFTATHIHQLSAAGYSGFLVGESLMKAEDPAGAIRALCS